MLAGLKILSDVEKTTKLLVKHGVSLKALRASQKQGAVTSRIIASTAKLRINTRDFTDLRRLRNVASTQGLSRPLMMFANPGDKVISVISKNIPSFESLDNVSIRPGDRRNIAAIEGLSETIDQEPALISEWTRSSGGDIGDLLGSIEDQLKDLGESISQFLETLEGSEASDDTLATLTVEAVPYAAALARVEALLEVLPDLDAIVSNPADGDAMDIYKAKVASLVEKIGAIAGIGLDPENPSLIVSNDLSSEYVPQQGTLAELGYTSPSTVELLKKTDQLIDELNGLLERKESMVAHFSETADTISQLDNTVPAAGAEGDDSLTQADMYHCQVSSHLYSLTVIVGVSVAAVQEVLAVANELSGGDAPIEDTEQVPE